MRRTIPPDPSAEDPLDVAFVEIDHIVDELGDVRFLQPSELDPDDAAIGRHQVYVALGFPWRKTKADHLTRTARSAMMSVTALSDSDLFTKLQVEDHAHVVLPFDRKNMISEGKRLTSPKPEGMSGGGLWRSDHMESYASGRAVGKLVGILTRYSDRDVKHMRATRISLFTTALSWTYPELSTWLPRARRFNANNRHLS